MWLCIWIDTHTCHTYQYIYMCVTWLVFVWHDSYMCVTWLLYMRVPWLVDVCDTTPLYAWHDCYLSVTWLLYMCDMTRRCVWHDSFICVTWLVYVCGVTPLYAWYDCLFVWHDSFICVWHDYMYWTRVWYVRGLPRKTCGNVGSRNQFKSDLLRLWLQLVGSIKL